MFATLKVNPLDRPEFLRMLANLNNMLKCEKKPSACGLLQTKQ